MSFSDASIKVIATVLSLKVSERNSQISFIMGKTKLVPQHERSIPRLEQKAAVLATKLNETTSSEINSLPIHYLLHRQQGSLKIYPQQHKIGPPC